MRSICLLRFVGWLVAWCGNVMVAVPDVLCAMNTAEQCGAGGGSYGMWIFG
ncbi:MAG: hypothetical protein M2R45_01148 [Verrucomicrobia subdivision 3 bacterium]|nr:hypothetical protein [Limisphaerales bacterium]MCS1415298.1 hypothetical protein [Limisphaerales bacterium]